MKAVIVSPPGDAGQLNISSWEKPVPNQHEILVKVAATAINRADILQRKGSYPPPKGASPILGLEISGEVTKAGKNVTRWKAGDKVFGLLPGGGYAQYAVIHQDMAMSMPNNLSFEQAAAIPEVFLTAYLALQWLANLQPKEKLLIHAGASGVGTAAIQLAKHMQAGQIIITASAPKHPLCLNLGVDHAIDYKTQDFQEKVLAYTQQEGVDVIIDFIAAPYLHKNMHCLRTDGRLVLLALLGGAKADSFDMGEVLQKRLQIIGSTLRSRSLDYQIRLTKDFADFALSKFQHQQLHPVIDKVFDWQDVQQAHKYMESNQNTGKIVMKVH